MSLHEITPGSSVSIADVPTNGKSFQSDRDATEDAFAELRDELIDWQVRLYAERKQKLLVVFQAMDAGGKDGTIRKVFRGVNPQGVRVHSFKAPSHVERAHDFLWRVHQVVPACGMIGVFNRSHYEDVLVVRVEKLAPEEVWRKRYAQINAFEQLLAESGTRLLKFFLHISKDEQQERLQARLDEPAKHWKFSIDDLAKRKQWPAYMEAYEEMLSRCSTEHAPWHVIPANQKWYRNWAISRVLVDTLRDMNPQYPEAEDHLDEVVIE